MPDDPSKQARDIEALRQKVKDQERYLRDLGDRLDNMSADLAAHERERKAGDVRSKKSRDEAADSD